MSVWLKFSQAELDQWRDSDVGRSVRTVLFTLVDRQKEAMKAAYWAGRPYPEDARLAIGRVEEILEDWFEKPADAFVAVMEPDDGSSEVAPD